MIKGIKQGVSLRIVNILGLAIILACMVLSYVYVKQEWSYDRFHERADRIVRLSLQYDEQPLDVRIYGFLPGSPLVADIPEVEDIVLLSKVNTGLITNVEEPYIVNDFYFASPDFFKVFSFRLLLGNATTALDTPGKVALSQTLARNLFGESSAVGKRLSIDGGRMAGEMDFVVSAVFEDFPENSHFHTDMLVSRTADMAEFTYVYLLLNDATALESVRTKIADRAERHYKDSPVSVRPHLMPLTDIHLHSHFQREHESNGNISYLYMIAGANVLLLMVVLCNLWLNAGLLFSYNRRLYQLLRLNGASAVRVVGRESAFAGLLITVSFAFAGLLVVTCGQALDIAYTRLTVGEVAVFGLSFAFVVALFSLLPVFRNLHTTLFRYESHGTDSSRHPLSGIKYMLVAQFSLVMFIVAVAVAVSFQLELIRSSQVGGKDRNILVLKEQPDKIKENYELLKAELLKHPEIEAVTAGMQLPGDDIRDGMLVWTEDETREKGRYMNILVGDDNLLPFFDVRPIVGRSFNMLSRTLREEQESFYDYSIGGEPSLYEEEYLINQQALATFGFRHPEEAIGKYLHFEHGSLGYVAGGRICGVVEDFNYTTVYYDSQPLVIMARKLFLNCMMVRLQPGKEQEAIRVFNRVWDEVNPDYPANYFFMHDVYGKLYHNEMGMELLVRIFSVLCIVIANLGLIVFMSFVVKRRTREIAIRKVNGATSREIVGMLNRSFLVWLGVSFFIALPFSYMVIHKWLEHFAYRIALSGWIFLLAGLSVLLVSVLCISWKSWRASVINPTEAINRE